MILQNLDSDQRERAQSDSLEEEKKAVNIETIAKDEKEKIKKQMLDDSALKRFLGQRCMPIITERSVECTEILMDEEESSKAENNQAQNNHQAKAKNVASHR